jgi:hypothetical protein
MTAPAQARGAGSAGAGGAPPPGDGNYLSVLAVRKLNGITLPVITCLDDSVMTVHRTPPAIVNKILAGEPIEVDKCAIFYDEIEEIRRCTGKRVVIRLP